VLLLANVWDAGSARLIESLGFEATATTSLGLANALGRPDGIGAVNRDDALANSRAIAAAVDIPVSADLENGYADDPTEAATIIIDAARAGMVGGSIEDATGLPARPIYDFTLAVERVVAAVEAARTLPFPFTVTARAENLLHGVGTLDETVRRLQAFADVGADVVFAPGLGDLDVIRQVASSVSRPLNVVMSMGNPSLTVSDLADAGVKRISVGGALSRLALAAVRDAAVAMRDEGRFDWVSRAIPTRELRGLFDRQNRS
jgi:2-methylisocitrate lyase-like PEP mutase family enzyme